MSHFFIKKTFMFLILLSVAVADVTALEDAAKPENTILPLTTEERAQYEKTSTISPRYWDMYHKKKDRLYLDGVWKLKWGENVLTEKFIKDNMFLGRLAKSKGLKLKKGISIKYSDFKDDIGLKDKYFNSEYNDNTWMDILVPMPWNAIMPWEKGPIRKNQAVPFIDRHGKFRSYYFGGIGYYRKQFTIPAKKKGQRCFIHFMNVDVIARVWVNSQLLSKTDHINMSLDPSYRVAGAWMNAFEIEIPANVLNYGDKKNVVTVRVFAKGVPCYWKKPSPGGITAPVWIEFRNSIFAKKIQIVPFYKKKGIELSFSLNGAKDCEGTIIIEPWKSQNYSFPGKVKNFEKKFTVSNGEFIERINLPEVEEWSPEKPCLYNLKILDSSGRILGMERFGISVLEAKNGKFYINGKNIFMFGLNTHHAMFTAGGGGNPAEYSQNRLMMNSENEGRNILRNRKKAGFNYMRIHTGPAAPWCFSICDEVGLIASDEWTPFYSEAVFLDSDDPEKEVEYLFRNGYGPYTNDKKELRARYKKFFRKWISSSMKFPSLLLFNGGNEPKAYQDKDFQNYAKGLYSTFENYDARKRLFAPASGCHLNIGTGSSLNIGKGDTQLPATYWDFHNYRPEVKGSLLNTRSLYYDSIKTVHDFFGRKNIPIINGETYLGFTSETNEITVDSRWNFIEKNSKAKLDDFLKHGLKAQYHQLSAIHHGIASLFDYRKMCEERMLWLKKHIENIRYAIPEMQGYALHIPDNWWMRKIKDGKRAENEWGSFEIDEFAMAQAPTQIMVKGLHEISVFAGEQTSQDFVIVNNTSRIFNDVKVKITIDKKEIKNLSVATITPESITNFKADFIIPSTFTTGVYKMELDLLDNGKRVSTNQYDVFVLKKSYPLAAFKTAYVMDSSSKTAERLARALKLQPLPFDGKNKAKLLIVGPGALSGKPDAKLAKWIKKGGRAFIMEQAAGTENPWLKQRIESRNGFAWPMSSSAVKKTHIINRDMHFRNFGYWRKNAIAYQTYFPALTKDALIVGSKPGYSYWNGRPPGFGMVATGQGVGRGRYVWTQLKIADNFEDDAAAYCLARNMIMYLMQN